MTSLKRFDFAFGLGRDLEFLEITRQLKHITPEIDPFYLISCDTLVSKAGSIVELPSRLALTDHILKNRLMLDSAGYSIYSGNRNVITLPTHLIAELYNDFQGPLCISPDAPMYFINWSENLWINKTRLQSFYREYKQNDCKLIYNVIHGEYFENGRFTAKYRDHWLRNMAMLSEIKADGSALRLPDRYAGLKAQAYFALQPWSHGIRNCHLLAAGGITYFPLLVYLAENCYQTLTADAKSHTIDAVENLITRVPDELGIPRVLELSREKYRADKFRYCNCKICLHFETTEHTTMQALAEENKIKGGTTNKILARWIIMHNIYVIETYIDRLRSLVKDRKAFFAFLEEAGMAETIEAIEFVDQLLDDPHKYVSSIDLLMNPQK